MSARTGETEPQAAPVPRPGGRRLSRPQDGAPAAPVRMVHLGAGAFFRSHQAWFTHQSQDAADWGIAAFTGRRPRVAAELSGQDCLYTLRVQDPLRAGDTVISSVSAAHDASDATAWAGYFRDPAVALVTCTVTENGYLHGPQGSLLDDPDLAADIDRLRSHGASAAVVTAPARLVAGLAHRREGLGDVAPVALVPCDNLTDNGVVLEQVVLDVVGASFPSLTDWARRNVSFVSTVVDRITPHSTPADRDRLLRETGVDDPAMVSAESYTEWVMAGTFPRGRPTWESAGARIVADVAPYAQRKLHLLNAAHSLMAYSGSLVGHHTMSEAMTDPLVSGWVEDWWEVAVERLRLPRDDSATYCRSLFERFANPMVRHPLAQTATDGTQKLAVRVAPVLRAELARGMPRPGATRPVAAWVAHLRGAGAAEVRDVDTATVERIQSTDQRAAVGAALSHLGFGRGDQLVDLVDEQVDELVALWRLRTLAR